MSLQTEFFEYLKKDIEKYHSRWYRKATEQWYNCYAQIDKDERVILWVKRPNRYGSFWVFVSITSYRISKIKDTTLKQEIKDYRKFNVSLKSLSMTPISLLDRGLSANNSWEIHWPVGFKIIDKTQFELAKKIILTQWKK